VSIRHDAYMFCIQNPGCQAYLFRRSLVELRDNHIKFAQQEIPTDIATYNASRNELEFKNGSRLNFCYCEKEQDVFRYQGAEMHWVGIDEGAHLTDSQINYLKTRNRIGSWVPERDKDRLPRFVIASNPGGPGHNYLKAVFIDPAPPETLFHDSTMRNPSDPEDKGWPTIFIPASMHDNRFIDENYEASFSGLAPEMARALREGDWDAVVGQALHTLDRARHQLRPFVPPRHWTRFQVMDWGTAAPFSVGWYCVSEGATLAGQEGWPDRWIPEGALIRYNEWYGWNERPNQGLRLAPQQVGRGIIEREEARDEVMDYRVADTECWAMKTGPSVMEWMMREDPRLIFRKSHKDRKRNYQEVLARLAGNPRVMDTGEAYEDPMFFVTADCLHFWRTVPSLTLDDTDPEKGPNTKLEDHIYDEVAYACRSRPYVSTQEDRWYQEWGEEARAARGGTLDPYSTM